MANGEQELTNVQIERQDIVDNAIYSLVNELVPARYREMLPMEVTDSGFAGKGVPWDQDWIAMMRDNIGEIIIAYLTCDVDSDEFEMEFYPYLKEED